MFNLITSEEDLILLGKELSCRKNIAIDTEFRRTTKDNMKLSLVQINDSEEIYIIDCIALESNEEISKIFEDKNINKIIHSCREDIEALYSWTHKNIHNIFFTESFKSEVIIRQSIGRGLRKHSSKDVVKIYDFIDDFRYKTEDHDWVNYIYRHGIARRTIYKEEKFPFEVQNIRF